MEKNIYIFHSKLKMYIMLLCILFERFQQDFGEPTVGGEVTEYGEPTNE